MPDLQKKAKLVADFEAAKRSLAADPENAEANTIAGAYYCFILDDWSKGLPLLAKGNDRELQTLAARELDFPPTSIETQLETADVWWDAAQNAEPSKRLAMMRHAGRWYQKAQNEDLSGLVKIKVEKRLDELAAAEKKGSTNGSGPRPSVPFGRWFSLLASPNQLTGWETDNCRFSYVNRIIDLRGEAMFCPIIVKDASIRAKVKRNEASCVRLILRNCEQGCYMAQLDAANWSIIKQIRNQPGNGRHFPVEDVLSRLPVKRNFNGLVFEMGFSVAGDAMTVYFNRQAILQARDTAFTEGAVGIGTTNAQGLFLTNVDLLIPNKNALVDDRRAGGSP